MASSTFIEKTIETNEKDQEKLPKDQEDPIFTKNNGEFSDIHNLNIKVCDEEEESGSILNPKSALKKVVKDGFRTAKFGSTTSHCFKAPESIKDPSRQKFVSIDGEYVNKVKITYRYGNQQVAPNEGKTLGPESYMVKGFRDIEGPIRYHYLFGFNESNMAGYDLYERENPMVKKTLAGYSSISQL